MVFKMRLGTIQVDLDGLWTNLEYYGLDSDEEDIVFKSSIPRFLELFEKYNVKATFFLVGKDGEVGWKADLVKQLHNAGHEIANHTYSHPFGLRKLSLSEKQDEILKGEEVIRKITGVVPVGFKAPGYDIDVETLSVLSDKNYLYDSSVIPTPTYPAIMWLNRVLSGGVKRTHGPKWSWFFAPNKIYNPSSVKEWKAGEMNITELPCTVMPLLRLPHHATFSTMLGLNYFNLAHGMGKLTGNTLNYEFHAVDLSDDISVGKVKISNLKKRMNICKEIVKKISQDYEVVTSKELIRRRNENL
ncbi:polysaccharide deacetylase family protein [Nanoarchaeota archaeon]